MLTVENGPTINEIKELVERTVTGELVRFFRSKSIYMLLFFGCGCFILGSCITLYVLKFYYDGLSSVNSSLSAMNQNYKDIISEKDRSYGELKSKLAESFSTIDAQKKEITDLADQVSKLKMSTTFSARLSLKHDLDLLNISGIVIGSNPIVANGAFQILVDNECYIKIIDFTDAKEKSYASEVIGGHLYHASNISIPIDIIFSSLGRNKNASASAAFNTCYYYFSLAPQK